MSARSNLPNPFPGLRSFRSDEDYLFFGRDEQTMELLERLQRNRFMAVVGSSGRGKSSLVRCGLLSRLQGGGMVGAGAHWEIAVMHPGGHPLVQLAESMIEADLYNSEEEDVRPNLAATLRRSQFGLIEAVRQADLPTGTNFLLVVDQFEEIFRFEEAGSAESEMANDFIAMLLEACTQQDLPIYVVITMRSDFIGDCSRFEGLAEAVNHGEYLIPRLTREQFKSVIEGPIRVAGGHITPRLLQRLLNDLGEEQDQLPCLQHALMRTWRVWSEREGAEAIDLEDYHQVGKMSQALSLHADEIYNGFATDRQRQLCAAAFKALTVEGSEKRGIRRPRRLSTLCEILQVEKAELLPVLDAFRHAEVTFLQPPEGVELEDSTVIDLSHESLMRVWKRLRDWVDEEAKSVGIFRRLAESATLYQQGEAGLYREPELTVAWAWVEQSQPNATWAAQYGGDFEEVMAYLERSREAAEEEERAREAARQHELEQAKALAEAQRKRAEEQARFSARMKWLVRGMGLVAMVAIAAMVVAIFARKEAQENEARATESAKVALEEKARADQLAEKFRHQIYNVQLQRAASALKSGNGGLTRQYLQECEEALRNWEWYYLAHQADQRNDFIQSPGKERVSNIQYSPDGKHLLVTYSRRYGFQIWDLQSRTVVWDNLVEFTGSGGFGSNYVPAVYSPDGRLIASKSGGGIVEIWDVASRQKVREFEYGTGFHYLKFDPTGQTIWATSFGNRTATQWDLESGQVLQQVRSLTGRNWYPKLSPDGRMLCYFSSDIGVQVWDPKTSDKVFVIDPDGETYSWGTFSPDSKHLIVGHPNGLIRKYETQTWTLVREATNRYEEASGQFEQFAYSPDGKLLTGAVGSRVIVWDADTLEELANLMGASENMRALAISPDGSTVSGGDDAGEISFWKPQEISTKHLLTGHAGDLRLREVDFSPDGERLVSSGHDGTVRVWDVSTGLELLTLKGHEAWPNSVDYSKDGQWIVSAGVDHTVRIWDAITGAIRHTMRVPPSRFFWVDVSVDGSRILSGGNGAVKLFDAGTTTEVHSLELDYEAVEGMRFSPDGTRFATVPRDSGTVQIWDTQTKALVKSLELPGSIHRCLVFSPDGKEIAVGANNGIVFKWDLASGDLQTMRSGGGGHVGSIAYNPDGTRLFMGDRDGGFHVFDSSNGNHLISIQLTIDQLFSVKVSPDGKSVALSADDGVIHILETASVPYETIRRRRLIIIARSVVKTRSENYPLSTDLINSLQSDDSLDPEVKELALKLAETRGDIPKILLDLGLREMAQADATAQQKASGLHKIETAVALLPESATAHAILSVAQYIMGNPEEALVIAERANQLMLECHLIESAPALMVQAAVRHQRGDIAEAREIYERAKGAEIQIALATSQALQIATEWAEAVME